MAWLEVVVLALKFFFTEFPELLKKYKLYRLDKKYKNKELAYEEAVFQYRRGKIEDDRTARLKALRQIGSR